ncbi:MAG: hypothetical protein ACXVPQ_11430 [Bacteroidia bacterium]
MKYLLQFLFFLCVLPVIAQSKSKADPLKEMIQSDTLVFSAYNSGCFNAGTNTYTIVKLKNGEREVSYTRGAVPALKKITAKKFDAFIASMRSSMNRFKDPEEKPRCTMISVFTLKDKKHEIRFKNGSCEAQFNPEETLSQILK